MSYVHTKFDGICTDMKSETIKVFFPYTFSDPAVFIHLGASARIEITSVHGINAKQEVQADIRLSRFYSQIFYKPVCVINLHKD